MSYARHLFWAQYVVFVVSMSWLEQPVVWGICCVASVTPQGCQPGRMHWQPQKVAVLS